MANRNADRSGTAHTRKIRWRAAVMGTRDTAAGARGGSMALDYIIGRVEAPVVTHSVELVKNGSFELATFVGDAVDSYDYDYWTWETNDGNNSVLRPDNDPPSTNVIKLGNMYEDSRLYQNIRTVPGVTYSLSYWLFDTGVAGSSQWDAEGLNTIYFSASIDGVEIPESIYEVYYPDDDPGFDWVKKTFTFRATSASTELAFISRHAPREFMLTGISVT